MSFNNTRELEQNLEKIYEQKQTKMQFSKKRKANRVCLLLSQKNIINYFNIVMKEQDVNMEDSGIQVQSLNENKFRNPLLKDDEEMLENGIKRRKWFDKGLFNDDVSDDVSEQSEDAGEFDIPAANEPKKAYKKQKKTKQFINPLKKSHLSSKTAGDESEEEVQFATDEEDNSE